MEKEKRETIDWERIELDYRAGIKTLRQIGVEYGVSHPAINKRAKKEGWQRDLSEKIRQKAEALVSKAAVTRVVTPETKAAEKEIVEANANAVAAVRLAHRHDIHRARSVSMQLLAEMELSSGPENAGLLAELGRLVREQSNDDNDKRHDLFCKIVSLPGRAKTMKDLSETLRVLIALEREAFGLDDAANNSRSDPLGDLLKAISAGGSSALMPVAHDPEHDED